MPDGAAVEGALAEAAGLRLAWERHRADVEEALRGMAALRASFSRQWEASLLGRLRTK